MSQTNNYSAVRAEVDGIEVVRLRDEAHATSVSIAPTLGNKAYEFIVKGQNILWSPYATLGELKAKPAMAGNPFLAPWANRLDEDGFYANGKHYKLNPELKNYNHDGNQFPIHGLLVNASWQVVEVHADASGAVMKSRLEFWRHPDWMAQFPFAHTIEVTHRLHDGVLQVETAIHNLSDETMPVSVGYHTYYQLTDSPRDDWQVDLGAKEHVVLSPKLIPTQERKPLEERHIASLKGRTLDDVYTGLTGARVSEFSVRGKQQRINVLFGPQYKVAVVYAPGGNRNYICFEPMSGLTNAFNLAQRGEYADLQTIPSGGEWRESFWIQPVGF